MEKIKFNIIIIQHFEKCIKLSNGLFIANENECLKLFEIKNSKIKHICWSEELPWAPISFLELKDGNIITSGRKFICIFEIKNNKFNLIESIDEVKDFAELFNIIQLENEKILIASRIGKLIILEKRNKIYKITKIIDVNRFNFIEYISDNKILLFEYNLDNQDKTKITVLNFLNDKIEKKGVICGDKFRPILFYGIHSFKLNNEILFIIGEKLLLIYNIKYEEIISKVEIDDLIIDIINYENNKYLCLFKNNKISLISFKDQFSIEGTKIFEKKYFLLKLIMDNNKIYLIDWNSY